MSMENFFNSLTEDQKSTLRDLMSESEDESLKLPKEHKEALDELDPAYHDSYIMTHNLGDSNVNEDFTVKRGVEKSNRRTAVSGGKNKWKDTGSESRDIETPDFERSPRRKGSPAKKSVDCHVCGKAFKIDPRHTYGEYHRCNRCTGR